MPESFGQPNTPSGDAAAPGYADPSTPTPVAPVSPALVAIAGWAVPGLGYFLLGQRSRATVIMATILTLYVAGLLIAGIRVVDVPGYDKNGFQERVDARGFKTELGSSSYKNGTWMMFSSSAMGEVIAKPWYVGQFMVGPLNLLISLFSLHAASINVPMSHARVAEIGTLYTAVAGMLNLLAIIDSASRATEIQEDTVDEGAGE